MPTDLGTRDSVFEFTSTTWRFIFFQIVINNSVFSLRRLMIKKTFCECHQVLFESLLARLSAAIDHGIGFGKSIFGVGNQIRAVKNTCKISDWNATTKNVEIDNFLLYALFFQKKNNPCNWWILGKNDKGLTKVIWHKTKIHV